MGSRKMELKTRDEFENHCADALPYSDALITFIKVQQGFKGASLAEEFMGIPVLGIDAFCVIVGVGLAWWTWNTMRDD
eukprot:scaffold86834_cov48-Attheya_sp.AAC.3